MGTFHLTQTPSFYFFHFLFSVIMVLAAGNFNMPILYGLEYNYNWPSCAESNLCCFFPSVNTVKHGRWNFMRKCFTGLKPSTVQLDIVPVWSSTLDDWLASILNVPLNENEITLRSYFVFVSWFSLSRSETSLIVKKRCSKIRGRTVASKCLICFLLFPVKRHGNG